jgi:nucleotide-binding universal stress UspA family protein
VRILVAVDLSECSAAACRWALERSAGLGIEKIIFHHALDPDDTGALGDLERATGVVRRFVEGLEPFGSLPEQARVAYAISRGRPADEILKTAAAHRVDTIATGTRGRTGLDRLLLGSVAEAVVRRAGCTVIVVKA